MLGHERRKEKAVSATSLLVVFISSMVVVGLIVFLVLSIILDTPTQQTAYMPRSDGIRIIDPPRPVMDFTLLSQTGEPLRLSDFRGRHVIVFFGYTGCPDVCPITISEMKQARAALADQADNVAFLFISVDPARDTPDRLTRFLAMRDVDEYMMAMQGDDVTLARITPDYGLYYERYEEDADVNGYYIVDHTANSYVIDPLGRMMGIIPYGTAPDIIANYLSENL